MCYYLLGFIGCSLSNYLTSDEHFSRCDKNCHAYHKRLDDYCHRLLLRSQLKLEKQFLSARENDLPAHIANSYALQQVHIVARHGDRSPTSQYQLGLSRVYYECGLVQGQESWKWVGLRDFPHLKALLYETEKVHFEHQSLFPGTNSKECGVGKLTREGYFQHRALGSMMNKKYAISILHNFSNIQEAVQSMYVQSTDYSRTLHSAGAFMLGFLPDQKEFRESTTIYVSPGILLQAPPPWMEPVFSNCKHLKGFSATNLWKTNYYQTELAKYNPLLEHLITMFQVTTLKRPIAREVFDSVVTRGCHVKENPLPCSSADKCMSYVFASKMFEYVDWTFLNTFTINGATVATLPLLRHSIYGAMREAVDGMDKAKKFILSVTHDTTIAQLLLALGVRQEVWMPYASRLVFELWKSTADTKSSSYYVRVLFNGIPLTHQLSAWKDIQEGSLHPELIPFLNWEEFVLKGVYKDIESYNKACKNY